MYVLPHAPRGPCGNAGHTPKPLTVRQTSRPLKEGTPVNEPAALLRVEKLCKAYPSADGTRITILADVSLEACCGETVAIVGPSGSGKSTLLNIIGSLEQPDSGAVWVEETDVTQLSGPALAQYRASRVAFVFQDHHLLPQLTARENVMLPSLAEGAAPVSAEAALHLLDSVGLAARADAFPARLSGGERQRVALARALVNSPALLLCDEPTGNLDEDTGAEVVALLSSLAEERKTTVLMVTHNLTHAAGFARRLRLREHRLEELPAAACEEPT